MTNETKKICENCGSNNINYLGTETGEIGSEDELTYIAEYECEDCQHTFGERVGSLTF